MYGDCVILPDPEGLNEITGCVLAAPVKDISAI
jgi:hypothetical protein